MVVTNRFGQTMLGLLSSLAIAAISITAVTSLASYVIKQKSRLDTMASLSETRSRLLGLLTDPAAIAQTLADPQNTSFDCVRNYDPCPVVTSQVAVHDAQGNVVNFILNPNVVGNSFGFREDGSSCGGFTTSQTSGKPRCPFQAKVSWTPICRNNFCINPDILWKVETNVDPRVSSDGTRLSDSVAAFEVRYTPDHAYPVDIEIGWAGHCTIMSDKTLRCWGNNLMLARGVGPDSSNPKPALIAPGVPLTGVLRYVDSQNTGCAILEPNRTVRCWGENNHAQLGRGILPPSMGGTLFEGYYADAEVRNADNSGPITGVSELYSAEQSTCAQIGGEIFCWGDTQDDITLVGANFFMADPLKIPGSYFDDVADSMALANPLRTNAAMNQFVPNNWTKFFSGVSLAYCFLIGYPGQLSCFGVGEELLMNNLPGNSVFVNQSARIPDVGAPRNNWPAATTSLSNVVSMDMVDNTACAVTADGHVACWGFRCAWAACGMIGDGIAGPGATQVTWVIDSTGNPASQLSNIVQISGSWSHFCATDSSGRVFCWGNNNHGQIGDGSTVEALFPKQVVGLPKPAIRVQAGSNYSSCALLIDHTVYCWGFNEFGQLGSGWTHAQLAETWLPLKVEGF